MGNQPGVYIGGGYQSPDIILIDPSGPVVPIGGAPGGQDTLLSPSTNYVLGADVNNSTENDVTTVVTFWAIPGGVGTNGTMLSSVSYIIPANMEGAYFQSPAPFKSAPAGGHLCAVVSLFCPQGGCPVDATTALEIPDPGDSGTQQCSAWRNTDSMWGVIGMGFQFPLGLGLLPIHLEEPIVLGINARHVPANILETPAVAKIADTLRALGAKSNMPIYLLPDIAKTLKAVHLEPSVKGVHGIEVKQGERGEWLLLPHKEAEKTALEIAGRVPETAKKGDVLLVQVAARYPRMKGRPARTVEFLEFVHVVDRKPEK